MPDLTAQLEILSLSDYHNEALRLPATQAECDELESRIAEYASLTRTIGHWKSIVYELEYVGHGEEEYLAKHYSVVSTMCSGMVRCEDWDEAKLFLNLLLERYASGGTIDPEAPNGIAAAIHLEGWRDAISSHVEDSSVEDLPIREAEVPYWVLEPMSERTQKSAGNFKTTSSIDSDHFLYTLNESNAYLCYPSEDIPSVEGCLLVHTVGCDSEAEVSLGGKECQHPNYYDSFEDYWGVPGGSLEAFLALQMVCHNRNLAKEFPEYAYVHYQLMGAVWLRPVPEAVTSFIALRKARYGCFSPDHNYSDRDECVDRWLDRIEGEIDDDTDPEIAMLIRVTSSEYKAE